MNNLNKFNSVKKSKSFNDNVGKPHMNDFLNFSETGTKSLQNSPQMQRKIFKTFEPEFSNDTEHEKNIDVIVTEFLNIVSLDRCVCKSKCKISDINNPVKNKLYTAIDLIKNEGKNCNIIVSGSNFSTKVKDEALTKISNYITLFIDIGLLKPVQNAKRKILWKGLSKESSQTSLSSLLSRKFYDTASFSTPFYSSSSSSRNSLSNLPEEVQRVYSWKNEPVNWNYIQNLRFQDLPAKFADYYLQEFQNDENAVVTLCKVLFWLFRKAIVDNLLVSLVNGEDCVAISGGSVKITSDYDVTLYGNCAALTGSFFMNNIISRFGDVPSNIFDTNVYSSSFMSMLELSFPKNAWFMEGKCSNMKFWYLKSIPELASDQHVWAAMKVVHSIEKLAKIDKDVAEFFDFLLDKDVLFTDLLKIMDEIMESKVTQDSIIFMGDSGTIKSIRDFANNRSMANIKGSETYFTRGAFMDVVLNQQLCPNNPIYLDKDAFIDSFLENISDFCAHGKKEKYSKRAINAMEKVSPEMALEIIELIEQDDNVILLEKVWEMVTQLVDSYYTVEQIVRTLAVRTVPSSMEDLFTNFDSSSDDKSLSGDDFSY